MSCLGGRRTLCSVVLTGERRNFFSPGKGVTWPPCSHLPGARVCADAVTLLPRDLKRDVAKKLEKLEKRTQRAIAELIRALRCRRDGVWGHRLFQRDDTILTGSLVPCCWAREGLVELDPLPERVCEAVHTKQLPPGRTPAWLVWQGGMVCGFGGCSLGPPPFGFPGISKPLLFLACRRAVERAGGGAGVCCGVGKAGGK